MATKRLILTDEQIDCILKYMTDGNEQAEEILYNLEMLRDWQGEYEVDISDLPTATFVPEDE